MNSCDHCGHDAELTETNYGAICNECLDSISGLPDIYPDESYYEDVEPVLNHHPHADVTAWQED